MRRSGLLALGLSLVLTGCGGGGDDDGPDDMGPDVPEPVASVEVEPDELDLLVGQDAQLTVTLRDANGNVLTGRTITYASDDASVATVSGTGLVTAVGAGETMVTATSEGVDGPVSLAVALPAFAPTDDVTVSGTQQYASLDVPEGVTVTLTGDAELRSEGDATVSGSIVGDCTSLTLGGASVTITGTLNNRCDGSTDLGPTLRIEANGALTIQGAGIASSGDVSITNDPTLTDADFDAALAPARNAAGFMGPCVVDDLVPVEGGISKTSDGAGSDAEGGVGSDSGNWLFDCNGDIDFNNGAEIDTPDAGDGGAGEDSDATDPDKDEVKGGDGGDGGRVRIRSTGDININSRTVIRLANGGAGGAATMVAGVPGGSASATGGAGGDSGTMTMQANGSINIGSAGLEIVVGDGGAGGMATATAADGADAGSEAAQPGGSATATGGAAGSTPDAQLRATGSVNGSDNVTLSGGDGGLGGAAFATAGDGGDGNQEFPTGAIGGDISARGGAGGSSLTSDLDGNIVGFGGDGGAASFAAGMGGMGFNGCSVEPAEMGGMGGNGGNGSGGGGAGGTGLIDGAEGAVAVAAGTGDGGDGGDGEDPGDGGMGGTDGIDPEAEDRTDAGPNFQDGEKGDPCNPAEIDLTLLPVEFDHEVGVTSCPQVIGTFTMINNSDEDVEWSATTSQPLGFQGSGTSAGGTIPAGEEVTVTVIFDCSQTTSFTETITVTIDGQEFTIQATRDIDGNVG